MMNPRNKQEVSIMREGGHLLASVLDQVKNAVTVGVSLKELEEIARTGILKCKAVPAFKGYAPRPGDTPFSSVMCASVDSEVVHGPASRNIILQNGSIIGLDLGLKYKGMFTDMAVTVPVGTVVTKAHHLMEVTKDALSYGIAASLAGNTILDVSKAIYAYITKNKYGVVTGFCGHGVGKKVHEEPLIPNYPTEQAGNIILQEGMTIAIEPMVTVGDPTLSIDEDGWTARTVDGKLAAHFEHTIVITKGPAEILTTL